MRRPTTLLLAALFMAAAAFSSMPATARDQVGGAAVDGIHDGVVGAGVAAGTRGAADTRNGLVYKAPIYSSGFGRAYGMRPGSAFTSGLIGGFLGAGLGGLLFGGGFFRAMHGAPGVLGVLLQLLITYTLAVWLYRRFAERVSPASSGLYARLFYTGAGAGAPSGAAKPGFFGGGRSGRPITLSAADFRSFEELLHCMQTAWSAHDIGALRSMTTPDMAEAYAQQIADQDLRGVRNQVSDVRLQQGDVTEAWSDGRRDHATVSMHFSMFDVTLDQNGRVVDGSETERISVKEYWSFIRTTRSRWVVSAIEEPK